MRLDRGEVTLRLRVDQAPERVRPVDRMIGRELEEPAARRATLVELPGRVQEAWSEPGRGRAARRIAEHRTDPLEGCFGGRRRHDERLQREIGVRLAPGKMAPELADQR